MPGALPFLSTGGGGASSTSSAAQTQSFTANIGGNQGLNFAAPGDGWKLGLAAGVMLAVALVAYRAARKRKG